jgi:2-polyprenyl-6-methoxyphenol hydroxylase-like FAD-dependent oxidoreductase
MTAPHARSILVARRGIGGSSAALGLAQKGLSVVVLEKAPSLGEIGARTRTECLPLFRLPRGLQGSARWPSISTNFV